MKLGEKLIIYGKNFQKVGVKNIAFRLWNQTEEIKLVGKVVNDGQYEVIIPTTFAATIYRIRLYGNDNSSTASNFQVPIQK